MASGEAAGGKKRKAAASGAEDDITSAAARREPRRGLGVAELERIRVALEVAERCYAAAAAATSLSSAPQHRHHPPPAPALPPPTTLVVHAPGGVAAAPAHHHQQHVGNGAARHLQMTRGYLAPYCLAQHYYGNDSLTSRLFTTNGGSHRSSHHNQHSSSHHNHYCQADQNQSAVTALPVMGQAASSESSSSASQRQGPRRRAHPKPGQTTAPPQVAFVDLVDSDDDTVAGDVEELDLELKL